SRAVSSSTVFTATTAPPPSTRLRMSSMRFMPEAFWISCSLLNSSSVSLALIRRVRLPVSMGGLPGFFLGLSMGFNMIFGRCFGRKTKLRRFFPLCPRLPDRGAARQRQGGFRGTRKHNLQLTKQRGDVVGVLAADRMFPLADALVAACGNSGDL